MQINYTFNDGNAGAQGTGVRHRKRQRHGRHHGVNDAPAITAPNGGNPAAINVAENSTAVTDIDATDLDGPTLTYSISGGADAAKFQINASTGVLTFIAAPNSKRRRMRARTTSTTSWCRFPTGR